jgi:hypothetical protein
MRAHIWGGLFKRGERYKNQKTRTDVPCRGLGLSPSVKAANTANRPYQNK